MRGTKTRPIVRQRTVVIEGRRYRLNARQLEREDFTRGYRVMVTRLPNVVGTAEETRLYDRFYPIVPITSHAAEHRPNDDPPEVFAQSALDLAEQDARLRYETPNLPAEPAEVYTAEVNGHTVSVTAEIKLVDFGSLRALCSLDAGLFTVRGFKIIDQGDGKPWIASPTREIMRDGKKEYLDVVRFDDPAEKNKFQAWLIARFRLAQQQQ